MGESPANPLEQEVQRRIDELADNDWALRRYDRNGDGRLDENEWEVVRSLVRRQVLDEFEHLREHAEPKPLEPGERPAPVIVDMEELDQEWGVDTDPNIDMHARERLEGRYDVLHELGSGAQADTFLGRDLHTNEFVAIKELAVGRLDDWKSLELFERERDTLKRLDHPSIPRFIDTMEVESDGQRRFFIVQEFVDGDTIAAEIEQRGTFEDADLFNLARQVLGILEYLQSLTPAVVHRDVKPSNIIRRRHDGRIMLVDFGGVQNKRSASDIGGSTVVGTSGFMPPEQLMGRANPTSDLYALGATLAHLATGHHPSMLPERRARLDWRPYANVDERLAGFVDRLMEPIWEDRPSNAADARRLLSQTMSGRPTSQLVPVSDDPNAIVARPDHSFISIDRKPRHLSVRIPPRFSDQDLFLAVGLTVMAAVLGYWWTMIELWPLLAAAGVIGIGAIVAGVRAQVSTIVEATTKGFRIKKLHWGMAFKDTMIDEPLIGARPRVENATMTGLRQSKVLVGSIEGWHELESPTTWDEDAWMMHEINAFAEDLRDERVRNDPVNRLE